MADYIRDLRPAKWGSMINLRCRIGLRPALGEVPARGSGCGASGGRERQSRLGGPVDFCHCGRRGARDRAYRTISPNSAKQTSGASTDKISHPTSMRSPKLFRHHRGRSIESGRDAINTIAIATAYPIKRSIIAFYPFTNQDVNCANGGKL
jgi:hypothetical protein